MATDLQPTTGSFTHLASTTAGRPTRLHPVAARVRKNFDSSTHPELRNVESVYRAGHITLTGLVGSFYLKQLATSLACGVEGVEQIENRLDVADYPMPVRPLAV